MKCIDITRELLGSPVYPGDPAPHMEELRRIRLGDECNVSALYACLHNGTHLDAPRHFMPDGQTIDELPLTACIGECSVVEGEGLLLGAQAEEMLPKLKKRILFKGRVQISPSAAFVLSDAGLELLGVEAQSVSPAGMYGRGPSPAARGGHAPSRGAGSLEGGTGHLFSVRRPSENRGGGRRPVRAILLEREGIDWREDLWK